MGLPGYSEQERELEVAPFRRRHLHPAMAMPNGAITNGYAHSGVPVCLIRGGHDGLRVAEEGIRLLESLHEPVAVVCLAGQYRTGKSFFLNQLARRASPSTASGFKVGPTTESCTRGIWLWDPQPAVRNARGERVLFMDTEGIAATDNDESYDAKIFSLGLLLSSLFVFNTMGVIDEGAIDRLFLVSELTKHVCISADTGVDGAKPVVPSTGNGELEGDSEWQDAMAESRALAPHFPPFIWLLRDFMLDMQADGTSLTPNQYLEKSLELRDGASRRNQERNKIRMSIQILFAKRECLTLVRPVMDELQLRHAADLSDDDLRPEFISQMQHVRNRILSVVSPKLLFGKVMDGSKLAHLAKCYTETMNSGSIPDIKAAWAYVSEATCQTAMLNAMELYDAKMAPATYEEDAEETVEADVVLLTQQEFEKLHKDAQDEALNLFKNQSVEGATRAACFQKLKAHIQKQKTSLIATLQKKSTAMCEKLLKALKTEFLVQPMSSGHWDELFYERREGHEAPSMRFTETMAQLELIYETRAQGPAKKTAFYSFLREDMMQFHEDLFARLAKRHDTHKETWAKEREALQQAKQMMESQLQQQIHDKEMEIQRLLDAKIHAEEKVCMQQSRIQELQAQSEQQQAAFQTLEAKHGQTTALLESTQGEKTKFETELEKTKVLVDHTKSSLDQREAELRQAKVDWTNEVDGLRRSHQDQKEEWIQKLADQTAEKSSVQRTLKQRDLELQQKNHALELAKKEHEQLLHELNDERDARQRKEVECTELRELNESIEKRLEDSFAQQMLLQDEAERERQRLQQRLERYEIQLGTVEADRDVQDLLRDCVAEVVRLAEVEKARLLQEERNVLQERLGELYVKISTLPDFYQREIFCSPDPEPSFFDALTQ